jgi:hypothetical protein
MPFILLLIGAVIAIAAFNNTQGDLAAELETDVPPFLKWALAIVGVGALGWIPGFQLISRWLLALVLVVLVLTNYRQILSGFTSLGGSAGAGQAASNPTPAQQYAANPNNPQITTAATSGSSTGAGTNNVNAAGQPAQIAASPFGAFDPHQFLAAFEVGFGGFGGIA